ncbi:MAG: DUF3343 domain-containing protein [Schaedlerella sp.]|nr:DUF3343 domain-containing protein [Schaedlerella sp.]
MKVMQHYVLFPNHDNGMRLYKELKALGRKPVIVPTPRQASKCCGISLLVKEEDLEAVKQCIEEHDIEIWGISEIEKDVKPNRDRYC